MTEVSDEWLKAERAHERMVVEERNRRDRFHAEHRTERLGYFAIALAVVGVVAAIVWGVVTVAENVSRANLERDRMCTEAGGSRVQVGGDRGPFVCAMFPIEAQR